METIESGALSHPNVIAIRNYQAAMAKGDYENAVKVFDPEVVYIVPGNNILSGTYKGPEQVMSYLGKLMELTGGSYNISEMHWLVNENNQVVLFIKNNAIINTHQLDWEETILFEFKSGKKYRIEHFQSNQADVDVFFGK